MEENIFYRSATEGLNTLHKASLFNVAEAKDPFLLLAGLVRPLRMVNGIT